MLMIAAPSNWARTRSGLTTVPQSIPMSRRGIRDLAVIADGDVSDHRDIAQEAAMDRDAAALPRRQFLAPVAVRDDEVEYAAQAPGVDLWHGVLPGAAMGCGSFLERIEIGNDVLPIGLTGELHKHLGPLNEAARVSQEFVEVSVVPGDIRVLHCRREIEARD
jgi:hypothetical protein